MFSLITKIIKQLPELQNQGILDEEIARLRNYKLPTEIAELQAKLSLMNLKTIFLLTLQKYLCLFVVK